MMALMLSALSSLVVLMLLVRYPSRVESLVPTWAGSGLSESGAKLQLSTRLMLGRAGPAGLALTGLLLGSPGLTIAGPLLWIGVWRLVATSRRRRREARQEVQLLALVDQIGHELRSGSSLASAFGLACEQQLLGDGGRGESLAVSLKPVVEAVSAGDRLEIGLQRLLDTPAQKGEGDLAVRLLAVAVVVLVESGGPAAPAIERLSETLRTRQAAMDEVRTQASQATASAAVLAGLPLVFGLLLAAADRRIAHFYFWSPVGAACIVGSLVLVAAGWTWMQKLVWQ